MYASVKCRRLRIGRCEFRLKIVARISIFRRRFPSPVEVLIMFTQGLDRNGVRWVQEKSRIDSVASRIGGRDIGLPPHSKFASGHLPSHAVHFPKDDESVSSDDETSLDSDEDMYRGKHSLDSSPQYGRIPSSGTHKFAKPMNGRPQSASSYMYSDVSSSVETREGTRAAERHMKFNHLYPVKQSSYTEDESTNSGASSEYSSTQVGRDSGAVPHCNGNTAGQYNSRAFSRFNTNNGANKNVGKYGTRVFEDDVDIPSAPPMYGSVPEIKEGSHKVGLFQSQKQSQNVKQGPTTTNEEKKAQSGILQDRTGNGSHSVRESGGVEAAVCSGAGAVSARLPTFHASALGPWYAVISYDACVRLCLNAWSRGCQEAPMFLENECNLIREAFGLQQVLLQSEEELMTKRSSELGSEAVAAAAPPKPKKFIGKLKVQVRKVRMSPDAPTGCSMSSIKRPAVNMESVRYRVLSIKSAVSSGCTALRKIRFAPQAPFHGSFSRQSLAYVQASTQYIKQVSALLKIGASTLRRNRSSNDVPETYACLLRLKSSDEDDSVPMQPGSSESHVFFPDSLGDDLIVEVRDSKGRHVGRVVAQVVTIAEDQTDKLRWWSIYSEPEHELVGKLQLHIIYKTSSDDTNLKCGSVAETVAYDMVMEVAMKAQQFRQRNLLIDGPWQWLLTEFASYYGVSSIYTKLRYVSYIMEVATPTSDCLSLVYDLLLPVIMKGHAKNTLSHQENRILGEIRDQLEHVLALVFENYKSLDESSLSGLMDVFRPATGVVAPALKPAINLYTLLHDILLPEVQTNLCQYFQVAAKRRSRRHLAETDEYVTCNTEGESIDFVIMCTAYQKMKSLCLNIRNEIFTDIEIHNKHILPSFIDLPNLSASIYSTELSNRMRAFLIACPPTGPSPPVTELVIATSDLQRDIDSWGINPIKGGVDAKELFHLYIMIWIQDRRLALLESCKLDKIKWAGVRTKHSTTPFVDGMYDRLKDTLNEYDIIISRWPEYIFTLENAIADVEKAIIETLDKQYADVLAPLKENIGPKTFGLKYVQKLAKRSVCPYIVPDELGILLNSMKRMLDALRPRIEKQFKSWGACIPDGGNTAPGDNLSEVTVMLRAKFRNYNQAIVELLSENAKLQNATKLKKILQDSKNNVAEADVRNRMQPLVDQLTSTISHLHSIFENQVFTAICRGYWDKIGQEVLGFLENRKENRAWYKGSRVAVSVLDDTFASQMQHLLGNSIQEKDLEPPRSIMEVRSILCKEAPNHKDNSYYY
ncbi:hypothetical protein QQ045_001676 [Rhodiola kirilowii]